VEWKTKLMKPASHSSVFFVTGATGFLGGRTVEMLIEAGHRVLALGRNPKAGARLTALGAEFIQGDLGDRALLARSVPKGAYIIHCAALSSPWGTHEEFYQANVIGTRNIATVALEQETSRFVHISTPSIYVEKKSKELIRESDPLPSSMINLYAETKLQAEKEIDLCVARGLPAITLRPQGIFGPHDQTILPRLVRVAQKGFIPVIGKESVRIDLTYVDNVVQAIFDAIEAKPEAIGKKYNITNGQPVEQLSTLKSLLGSLGYRVKEKKISLGTAWNIAGALEGTYRLLPLSGEPVLTRYSVCTLAFTRTLSIEAAHEDLGYTPKISVEEGLKRTIQQYQKENPLS
jgi:nucleoside-diphosphate-sugar epimerase